MLFFSNCCRYTWNWALARKQEYFNLTSIGLSPNTLSSELTRLKLGPDAAFLRDCSAQMLQQVLFDLNTAFIRFFRGELKYPKFKTKKKSKESFRFTRKVYIKDNTVCIPRIGFIRATIHRPICGVFKSATIKKESSGKWYIIFVSHIEQPELSLYSNNPLGIDVGLETLVTLDDGTKVKPPKYYRRSQKKLRKLQKHLSRCQLGSTNKKQARLRVAKHHAKVANQRKDFLHKLSKLLVDRYDTICVEDLNLKTLARTKLSKSFSDASIGALIRMLTYKGEWYGTRITKVGRFYPSSKTCHICLHKQDLTLADRKWLCNSCGTLHDRDVNAAINIRNEGLRILAAGSADIQNANRGNVRLAMVSKSR